MTSAKISSDFTADERKAIFLGSKSKTYSQLAREFSASPYVIKKVIAAEAERTEDSVKIANLALENIQSGQGENVSIAFDSELERLIKQIVEHLSKREDIEEIIIRPKAKRAFFRIMIGKDY